MELTKTAPPGPPTPASSSGKNGRPERGRKRWEMTSANVRFFLLKPGSSADKPELGREMASENEALVEAFRNGADTLYRRCLESRAGFGQRVWPKDREGGFAPNLIGKHELAQVF